MGVKISPSIMCADLLHMEDEIRKLEEAKVDFIHYDLMDTTFTTQTMLPFIMIPMIQKITKIPMDIHVMIDRPERILQELLPYCKGAYIGIHVEVTKEIVSIFTQIHEAKGKCCAVVNAGTPISVLEELLPHVDMINLILGNAGFCARQPLDNQLLNKIRRVKTMLINAHREDVLLEVDGGVSFDVAQKTQAAGADTFVLGTKSIYRKGVSVAEECHKLRALLENV